MKRRSGVKGKGWVGRGLEVSSFPMHASTLSGSVLLTWFILKLHQMGFEAFMYLKVESKVSKLFIFLYKVCAGALPVPHLVVPLNLTPCVILELSTTTEMRVWGLPCITL